MSITIPKNVRQMGEPEESRKIYVEDYVITYLRQYAKEEVQKKRMAILLGHREEQDGIPYLFVKSALAVRELVQMDDAFLLSDDAWTELCEEAGERFAGQEILGWFLSTPGYAPEVTYACRRTQDRYFSGEHKLLFLEDPTEGEAAFFAMEGLDLKRQQGFFVFYERNEPMQQYMLEKKDGKSVDAEMGFSDRAARSFRSVVQEKREEHSQKRIFSFFYGACTCLVLVMLVIGISMTNQYEKMEQVELALQSLTQNLENQQESVPVSSEIVVEAETDYAADEIAEVEAEVPKESEPEMGNGLEMEQEILTETTIPETYIIQPGDTLLTISKKFYGDNSYIEEICEMNKIDDIDKIFVGEKILLP